MCVCGGVGGCAVSLCRRSVIGLYLVQSLGGIQYHRIGMLHCPSCLLKNDIGGLCDIFRRCAEKDKELKYLEIEPRKQMLPFNSEVLLVYS